MIEKILDNDFMARSSCFHQRSVSIEGLPGQQKDTAHARLTSRELQLTGQKGKAGHRARDESRQCPSNLSSVSISPFGLCQFEL